MTKPKAKQPLESFDPRMLELLKQGARRKIIIPFPGPKGKPNAHAFQRRLHTLRARMRQENHEHATLTSRCYVRLLWGAKAVDEGLVRDLDREQWSADPKGLLGAFILVQPMDAQFDEVLSGLDLGLDDRPPIPLSPLEETVELSLEDMLRSIPEEKE